MVINVSSSGRLPMPREVVRRARLSDAQAIAAIHVSVSRKTYANLIPADTINQFPIERRAEQWHRTIEMPDDVDTAVFVAEDAENAIGVWLLQSTAFRRVGGKRVQW
jgi:hypothetical protein